jgi:hypothetical protein
MAQIASEVARLKKLGAAFDVRDLPKPAGTTNVYAIQGTSLDQGYLASAAPYTRVTITDPNPYTWSNLSVSGQDARVMCPAITDREAKLFNRNASRNIAWNGGVTNSIAVYGETPTMALQDMLCWSHRDQAIGFKTIGTTMTSRSGTGPGQTLTNEVLKQQVNALLLPNGDEFDWLANPAAAPQIGADGAYANATYFADTSTHFTDAGQVYFYQAMQCAYNGVYGTPLTTVSGNYQVLCSDRVVNQTSASASTVTLIDANYANYNSKGKMCFKNSGTGTETLTPVNSETIDGSTTATVGAGLTVCLMPYVANPSAGGGNWVKVQP